MPKMILKCRDQLDQVPIVTKTKSDNYVTYCTDVVYTKNESELP